MKKLLFSFILYFMALPCFAVEVSNYNQLKDAINANEAIVVISTDIAFGSTPLTATKDITLTTLIGSTATIKGNDVSPMITFQGAGSTISNISFSSTTQSTSVNPAVYINVGAATPGQTYSTFTIDNVEFAYNTSNTADGKGGALNINSQQGTYINGVVFSTNSALGTDAKGGALYYEGSGDFRGRNVIFIENNAASDGGAIYASSISLTADENELQDLIVGNVFSSNTSLGGNGGAMYVSTATVSSTAFWDNKALAGNGGAIYASSITLTGQGTLFSALVGDFTSNYADGNGGAIYATQYADIKDSIFLLNSSTNTANGMGGAIYADTGSEVKLDTTYFIYNTAVKGGAIYSAGTMKITDSLFGGNEATSDGGAIYTTADTEISNVSFEENVAGGNGGAIYLDNATLNLKGIVNFVNNLSSGTGGAIYANNGTINLDTRGNAITFQGNTDSTGDNDIVLNGSSTLNISGGGSVNFYGGVVGGSITSNDTNLDWYTSSAYTGDLNMTGGTLSLHAPNSTLGNVTLDGTAINMQNGATDVLTTSSLNISGNNPLYIDVDPANDAADSFTVSGGSGSLEIGSYQQINLLSDSSSNPTFTFSGVTVNVNENEDYFGPLYIYNLQPTTGGDGFQLVRTNRTNPIISSLPVSANAKVMSNLHITTSLYNRIDVMFSRDRLNYRRTDNPQERFSGPQVDTENPITKDSVPTQSQNHIAWFIPNVGYQKVDYGNGIDDVSNTLYGGLIGIDFPFLMAKEAMLVPTFFVGYSGSKQEYQSATLHNDSIVAGGMLTFKNYFALLSAQLYITNGPESYRFKQYQDSFNVFSCTATVKGELDINLSENMVFQPAFTFFYNHSSLQDYTTVNGATISSSNFHNVVLSPSAKIMASINGWYPYLSGSINISTIQTGKVVADDLTLPKYKLPNYVEGSIGIENTFFKDYSGYVQVSGYAGNMRGIAFQMGLRGYLD